MPSTNFHILEKEWPAIYEVAREAESVAGRDPRTAAIKSRFTLEHLIKWLYEHDGDLEIPYNTKLNTLLKDTSFKNLVDAHLLNDLHYVRKVGNVAVHNLKGPRSKEAIASLKYLHLFCQWLVASYGKEQYDLQKFDESLIPSGEYKPSTLAQVESFAREVDEPITGFTRQKIEEKGKPQEKQKLEEQFKQVRETKDKNRSRPFEPKAPYSEEETRKLVIDLLLLEAGWDLDETNVREYEVQGMPNQSGIGYVDYVLWGRDHKPVALVEAKKTLYSPKKGQHQAKLYADCLEKKFNRRPLIFYSNGFQTWFWDDQDYPPREVQGFYTRDKLEYLIRNKPNRKNLKRDIRINKAITNRYYQEEGIRRVMERYEDRHRGALLVMATGTGKTRTAISMVDILIKANWARKVLFLADRTALVKQAKGAFDELTPHLTTVNLVKEKDEDNSRVVFSTYPTMMNRIDGEKVEGRKLYQVDYFDLIIIDEAHRSVYQKYGAIFEYFDALLLGLTATPKDDVDHNTYELFGHEEGVPAYYYELDQAVEDGYLNPYTKVEVVTKFHRQGIKYDELSEEEKERYELTFRDEYSGQVPDEIDARELYKWLFNQNTTNQILQYVMDNGLKIEGGDKLGKTIIFATNHQHAEFIVDQFDKLYPHLQGEFCQVIDNYVDYADDRLDRFKDPDKLPQIAVSVDMLDTGIDVPEILNLVFYKRVRSKSKFWQMIGRGTRLCEDLVGLGEDKEEFYIFDFLANFNFFDEQPEGLRPTHQTSLTQHIFIHRLHLEEAFQRFSDSTNAGDYENIRNQNLDALHTMVREIDTDSFVAKPYLDLLHEFSDRDRWNNLTSDDHHQLTHRLVSIVPTLQEEESSKRFDILMLQIMIGLVERGEIADGKRYKVQNIAEKLSQKGNIPAIRSKMNLIEEVRSNRIWEDATLHDMELVRSSLRELIDLLDKESKSTIVVNFEDTLESVATAAADPSEYKLRNNEDYQKKVEQYVKSHRNQLVIQKLRQNEAITQQELEQLEQLIFDGSDRGTKEQFQEAYGEEMPLSYFIRKILGMERKAAVKEFSDFLDKGNLNADQIHFINKLIDFLTEKGVIDKKKLFESPFTDINSQGVVGLFDKEQTNKIGKIIDRINEKAYPRSG